MGGKLLNFILKVVVPIIIIYLAFKYNILLGIVALLAAIALLLFRSRRAIYTFIGRVKYTKGSLEEATAWYEKAYRTGKAQPATISSYAYLLLKCGKVDESEEILNKLISSNPGKDDEMLAKSNLALVYWKKGRLDDAIELLEKVIAEYKTSTIYGSLGYLLILKGDMEKALAFNQEAYEYNDSNTVILDNMGQVYYLTGQYEKSAEIYEKLMAKNPTFPEAYYNYALLLLATDQVEKAVEMLEKSQNYQLSFLSTIKKEDIEKKLAEARERLSEKKE